MTKVLRRTMLAVLTVAALLCLSLVFASGLNPAAAYAEETPVANAQSRAAVTNIGSWDNSDNGLYFLIRDGGEGKLVSSVSYGGLMNVEQNTTIDLNGYSIIRTGASGDEYGSVFYVKPGITLTIKDTSSGGNAPLRWMMDNVYVRTDPAANIKMDKEKSTERIDGAVALVMALDRAIRHQSGGTSDSVYNERGIIVI